jgi:hypothetical protein
VNMRRASLHLVLVLAGALAAAACSRTLYEAESIPLEGALQCSDPGTHPCEALRACKPDDDVQYCEADCHECTTSVSGATPVCVANRCGYECPAGLLKCETGCCPAADVTAGGDHACAVAAGTGELLCWGANNDGQVGNGDASAADQLTPVKVPLPGRVVAASAGTAHTCAVVEGGSVWCWGRESSFFGGADYLYLPTEVPELQGALDIAAGGAHTCVLLAGGAVRCAGSWDVGGIPGDPIAAGADALAAGDDFTCALVAGRVRCWGANNHGQLGVTGRIAQPTTVPLPEPVGAIGLGAHHGCAFIPGDPYPVQCWSGTVESNTSPQPIPVGVVAPGSSPPEPYGLELVRYPVHQPGGLVAGKAHTCALREPSTAGVECWATTADTPVIGGTAPVEGAPVAVDLQGTPAQLSAGLNHTCAIVDVGVGAGTGAIRCWGHGERGQLGDGLQADSPAPVGVVSR